MTRADFYLRFVESLWIRNKQAQLQRLVLNEAQQILWAKTIAPALNTKKPLRVLSLKARQLGFSTLIQALLFARLVWENYVRAKVIAHEQDATKNIWEMSELMLTQSPFGPYARRFGTTMQLGESRLSCATAGSPHATRSMNLTCLQLEEVAVWQHPETWIAALQTVPLEGESWLAVGSTANGKLGTGKLFYDEWQRAQSGDSTFTPVFLPWHILTSYQMAGYVFSDDAKEGHAEHLVLTELDNEEQELRKSLSLSAAQLAWRREVIREKARGNVEWFHQEYPSTPEEAFIQSGLPMFSAAQLYPFRQSICKGRKFRLETDGRFVSDANGYVEIWQTPEPGHQYVIGADTSMGFADDSHSRAAAEIFDMATLEQVGEYDAAAPPHVMARHLATLGKRYNNALLCPEVQSSGGGGGRELVAYLMKDHNYYNLYRRRNTDHVKVEGQGMWGWETNSRTRPRMIARIQEVIHEKSVTLHSEKLMNQLSSFGLTDENRYEALAGHDDLLFAFGMALVSRSENYFKDFSAVPVTTPTLKDLQMAGVKVKPSPEMDQAEDWNERGLGEKTPNWLSA